MYRKCEEEKFSTVSHILFYFFSTCASNILEFFYYFISLFGVACQKIIRILLIKYFYDDASVFSHKYRFNKGGLYYRKKQKYFWKRKFWIIFRLFMLIVIIIYDFYLNSNLITWICSRGFYTACVQLVYCITFKICWYCRMYYLLWKVWFSKVRIFKKILKEKWSKFWIFEYRWRWILNINN